MTDKISRRSFFKKITSLTFAGVLSTTLGYLYARYIEPKMMKTVYHQIQHPLIPKSIPPVKIVQFSDTHIGHFFHVDDLEKIVFQINNEQPDLVFFTGDLLDNPYQYTTNAMSDQIIQVLQRIHAPLGKFSIFGNHDHGGYGTDLYLRIMNQSGFRLLHNEWEEITLSDGSSIVVAGLDDAILGRPNFDAIIHNKPSTFTILLAHEPDIFESTKKLPIHLQLSGHSHGGQVQIPFFGPIYTPPLGSKFFEGLHEDPHALLYVNRGLGTTRLPLRFLASPELTVFTLSSGEHKE